MEQQDWDTWGKLNELKCELNNILKRKTKFALCCTRQKYFEQGERAGKVLAHRVRQIKSQNIIALIFDTYIIFEDSNLITNKRHKYNIQGVLSRIIYISGWDR